MVSMPYTPPPYLGCLNLSEVAEEIEARRFPPTDSWKPTKITDSHIRIAADGSWYHEGSLIRRASMVRLFSSILSRDEADQHWLITPYEKSAVEVEDAAFVATDVARKQEGLAFLLNTDEFVIAGPENLLKAAGSHETPALYLAVRRGCLARLNRTTYQQLAEISLQENDDWTVRSMGETFSLIPQ